MLSEHEQIVPAGQVAANPYSPRLAESHKALRFLQASIESAGQLQACTAVTAEAFKRIFPEHAEIVGTAAYVVVQGSRRLAAIQQSELVTEVRLIVNDAVAEDRDRFAFDAITASLDHGEYTDAEEAKAVAVLVGTLGSAPRVAAFLGRSTKWVVERQSRHLK